MAPMVPIIDISDFEQRKDAIMDELMSAAEGVGFFQVVGHGLPLELVDKMFSASARRASRVCFKAGAVKMRAAPV